MEQIPVISMSAGIEKNPGLDINYKMADRALQALIYGDVFMRVLYKTRPYEAVPGSANALQKMVEDRTKIRSKRKTQRI